MTSIYITVSTYLKKNIWTKISSFRIRSISTFEVEWQKKIDQLPYRALQSIKD
jgi:hypothetical protein